MAKINLIDPDNRVERVEAEIGDSAMRAAVLHGVDGIVAECGGSALCATCHVYVDDKWISRLAAVGDDEDALLDGTASERQAGQQPAVVPDQDHATTRRSGAAAARTAGLI